MVCAGFFGRNAIPSPPLFLYGNLCLADKQTRKRANENFPLKLDLCAQNYARQTNRLPASIYHKKDFRSHIPA